MAPGDRGAGSVMRKSPLIAVLLGAACTGVGGSDSAGDGFAPNRIVEPVGPEQRLSLVEELRIGRMMGGDEAELLDVDHEVSVYGADGVLSRVVRMEVEPVPVTDAMLDELRRELVARCQRGATWRRRCERQRYVEEIVPATIAHAHERVPVISRLLVAPDGHLLISRRDLSETRASGDPRPHDLVSPEGRFLGRIEIPVNFRPLSVRGRNILGSWTDEFGVMYVVKYRVEGFREAE